MERAIEPVGTSSIAYQHEKQQRGKGPASTAATATKSRHAGTLERPHYYQNWPFISHHSIHVQQWCRSMQAGKSGRNNLCTNKTAITARSELLRRYLHNPMHPRMDGMCIASCLCVTSVLGQTDSVRSICLSSFYRPASFLPITANRHQSGHLVCPAVTSEGGEVAQLAKEFNCAALAAAAAVGMSENFIVSK